MYWKVVMDGLSCAEMHSATGCGNNMLKNNRRQRVLARWRGPAHKYTGRLEKLTHFPEIPIGHTTPGSWRGNFSWKVKHTSPCFIIDLKSEIWCIEVKHGGDIHYSRKSLKYGFGWMSFMEWFASVSFSSCVALAIFAYVCSYYRVKAKELQLAIALVASTRNCL